MPDDTLKAGERLGIYEIVGELGRGGMGVVYQAHEQSLNRMVALKVLPRHLAADPDFVRRFEREAQAAAGLSHPGIVTVYAVGEDSGRHYIAMEFVKGRTLGEAMETSGRLDPGWALEIASQICEALADAHAKGIIHRDIKPHNVMIEESGRVRMMDFGLAKALNDTKLTAAGSVLGTPTYMSPEQCEGAPADTRSDMYSVGVVLYEMLAGEPPYKGDTPFSLMRQIVDHPFPNVRDTLPNIDSEIVDLLERFIAKNPDDRYADAGTAASELRQQLAGDGAGASLLNAPTLLVSELDTQRGTPAPQDTASPWRSGALVGAVLALLFVLVLWGGVRWRRAAQEPVAEPAPVVAEPIPAPVEGASEPDPVDLFARPEPLDESTADDAQRTEDLPPELSDRVRTGTESVQPTISDEEAKRLAEEQRKAEEDARKRIEEERKRAEEESKRAEEDARRAAEEEEKSGLDKYKDLLGDIERVLDGDSGKSESNPGKGKGKKKK